MSMRLCLALLAIGLRAPFAAGDEPPTSQQAAAKITLLGGTISRETFAPEVELPTGAAAEPPVVGIDFHGSPRLSDGFLSVLKPFPGLQRLDLDDTRITAAGLRQLKELPALAELSLRNLDLDDAALGDLQTLSSLREIDLSGTKVTEAGRTALREAIPNLWIIDETESIRAFEKIDGIIERHPDRPGRPARSLRFRANHEFFPKYHRLLWALKHLESLDLDSRHEMLPSAFRELRRFPELTAIRLGYTRIDDVGLQTVGRLTRLKSLRLLACPNVSDAGLKELRNLEALTNLDLYGCPKITDAGLAELVPLKALEDLSFGEQKITEVGIAHLAGLPTLTRLSLQNCPQLTDAGAKELGKLSRLTSLFVWRAPITDAGVRELKGLTELQSLGLGGTAVTALGLQELRPLEKLRILSLDRTQLGPAGYKQIGEFQNLKHLYLSQTDITDEGLRELVRLPHLEELLLADCPHLTLTGLRQLVGHPRLKSLRLNGTVVTPEQQTELKKALPGVEIR